MSQQQLDKKSKQNRSIARIGIYLFIFFISLFIWAVFQPAFMNADSIVQYQQAVSGNFDDWHPALMSISLHYILKWGGSLALLTLFQSIIACFGLFLFSREMFKFISKGKAQSAQKSALLVLLILISPLSAFPFYTLAFIKDSWLGISLICLGFTYVYLLNNIRSRFDFTNLLIFLLMMLCMITSLLLRHNVLVLMPVYFFMIYWLLHQSAWLSAANFKNFSLKLLMGVSPLILYVIIFNLLYSSHHVKNTHPENQVFAMESLGVVVEDSSLLKDLSYMQQHLTPNYRKAYIPGNVAPIMPWGPIKAVDGEFSIHHPKLREEYFSLYSKAPYTLLKVKLEAFNNMLFPEYRYWFHPQLDENAYGLEQNEKFQYIRKAWIQAAHWVYGKDFFSNFFAEHLIWFGLNLLVVLFLIGWKAQRSSNGWTYLLLMLVPLAYYLSYFIASTGPQFRFMFPSSIFLQVMVLSTLIHLFNEYKASNKDILTFLK